MLIVADPVVCALGAFDAILDSLRRAGFVAHVDDRVCAEPDEALVDALAARARGLAPTAVVGVGGGSALDVAKLVALLATNQGSVREWLGPVTPAASVLPLTLVPTTTGTGAEATRIAMVTVDGAKRAVSCAQFVPALAVLDADLVALLPSGVVASTTMDALAHAVESLLSTGRNEFTTGAALRAIGLIRANLQRAHDDGDAAAKAELLHAAHLAGLALNAGVVLGHSLAYVVARRTRISHGSSCALALPYCLAYNRDAPDDISHLLGESVTGRPGATLLDAAEWVSDLAESLHQPTSFDGMEIADSEIAVMAAETVTDYPRPNNPIPLEAESLSGLYTHMSRGNLKDVWA